MTERSLERFAWVVPFAVGLLVALAGLFILVSGVDPSDFEASTGVSWDAFAQSEPGVASYLNRLLGLIGASAVGFGLLSAGVAYWGLRGGIRWSWVALWILPVTLGLFAGVLFLNGAVSLGAFYLGVALVALIGLLLPARRFLAGPA